MFNLIKSIFIAIIFSPFISSLLIGQEDIHLEWEASYFGPESLSTPVDIVVDEHNNAYVIGHTLSSGRRYDVVTLKYGSDGTENWTHIFRHPDDLSSFPVRLIINNDFIYVGTYSAKPGSGKFYRTILKYDSYGTLKWSSTFEGGTHGGAVDMAIDSEANIYLCGYGFQSQEGFGVELTKWDSSGSITWAKIFEGPTPKSFVPVAIVIDNLDNIVITGYIVLTENSDCFVLKYNSDGELLWYTQYSSPGYQYDTPYALAIDLRDNICVVGYGGFNIIKYNPSGSEEWDLKKEGFVAINSINIDHFDHINVSGGIFNEIDQKTDILTMQYTENRDDQWEQHYNDIGSNSAYAVALKLDSNSNLYVAGYTIIQVEEKLKRECILLEYSNEGILKWAAKYQDKNSLEDTPQAMAIDNLNDIYLTIRSVIGTKSKFTTVRYTQSINSISNFEFPDSQITKFSLQNYPNPFNPKTTISFSISETNHVTLEIYNVLGEKVATAFNQELHGGCYHYVWDASGFSSGLYFYRLRVGKFEQSNKMLL